MKRLRFIKTKKWSDNPHQSADKVLHRHSTTKIDKESLLNRKFSIVNILK